MNGFLLDTNVISELVKPRPNAGVVSWVESTVEELMFLSVLTLGEIRKGICLLPDVRKRARLEVWLERDLKNRFFRRVVPISEEIAHRWGSLSGDLARSGKQSSVVDGLLAATALEKHLTFVTRNTRDVARTGVDVLDPWV